MLWLLTRGKPDILDEHKQVPRICGRRREAEVPIEGNGAIVLGVHGQRADADYIRDLERAAKRVKQQPGTDASPLRAGVNGQPRKNQQRNRVTRHALNHPLGRVRMPNLAGYDGVETDNLAVADGHVGLRGIRLLGLQRVTNQEAIKLRLPASEMIDNVGAV